MRCLLDYLSKTDIYNNNDNNNNNNNKIIIIIIMIIIIIIIIIIIEPEGMCGKQIGNFLQKYVYLDQNMIISIFTN